MMGGKVWIEPSAISEADDLHNAIGGHRLIADTLIRRGVSDVGKAMAFINPDLYTPAPASDLPNLMRAIDRIETAIHKGETICVWGDFDVDGQTATTMLVSALRRLGADVSYHIPLRETESHGITIPILDGMIKSGGNLLLTCDTGVSAHESIDFASDHGVDTIVTDHHDLPQRLPDAYAVVNPKMLPLDHSLRELPGVGVAFKLVEELSLLSGSLHSDQFLDLVALGIVADSALQKGDVRFLLQRGLKALRETQRIGLQSMIELTGIQKEWLNEEHIGFVLAPRLNALGRLSDANVAVEFLSTDDPIRARMLASELEGLNARRKLLCDQVTRAAQEQIDAEPTLLDHAALVLAFSSWPAGVIGIVANRLAERYGRPTILFTIPTQEVARGSARSIEGVDISSAIATHRDMLFDFGGHPMAAGLSMDPAKIIDFRQALSRTIEEMSGGRIRHPVLRIDGYLSFADLSLDLIEDLDRLAPFGSGNPSLILATRGARIISKKEIGRGNEHLLLSIEDESETSRDVIWWHGAGWPLPDGHFDLAYTVRASDFKGQHDVQVVWTDVRPLEETSISLSEKPKVIEVVDYRNVADPLKVFESLPAIETLQVWSEVIESPGATGRSRYELEPAKGFVIWTVPPGPTELRDALDRVSPENVYLFMLDPGFSNPERFLERIAGLIKFALRMEGGRIRIKTLSVKTSQSEVAVRTGIAWLAARGDITIVVESEDELLIERGGMASGDTDLYFMSLKALLEEASAFREYCRTEQIKDLFQRRA